MKKFSLVKAGALTVLALVSWITWSSCADEEIFNLHTKYSFIGKTYSYQWTLQNTNRDFRLDLKFTTDSTYTLNSVRVEDEESMRSSPAEGSFTVDNDGTINFDQQYIATKIRGQHWVMYRAVFSDEDEDVLSVHRTLYFNTGNIRTDWIDFTRKK